MKCDYCQSLLSAYSDGVLNEIEKDALQQHLGTCASCQGEWQVLQRLRAMLSSCATASVPANMSHRIVEATQQAPSLPATRCEDVLKFLSPYIDDELDEMSSRCVLNHVAVCDDCYAELQMLERQSVLISQLPTLRVPLALKEAIYERIAHQSQGWLAGLLNRARAAATFTPRWSYGFAAATAVVLAAVLASHLRSPFVTSPEDYIQPKDFNPAVVAQLPPSLLDSREDAAPAARDIAPTRAEEPEDGDVAPIQVRSAVSPSSFKATSKSLIASVSLPSGVQPRGGTSAVPPRSRPKHEAKSPNAKPAGTTLDSLLRSLGNSVAKPSRSEGLVLPGGATPASAPVQEKVNEMVERMRGSGGADPGDGATEPGADVASMLAVARSLPFDSGLKVPDAYGGVAAQSANGTASRKIPLKTPALPLPKGGVTKDQTRKGQTADGLVIVTSGI